MLFLKDFSSYRDKITLLAFKKTFLRKLDASHYLPHFKDHCIELFEFFKNTIKQYKIINSVENKSISTNSSKPCLLTEAFNDVFSTDIRKSQKEDPSNYLNYVFFLENYFETVFETNTNNYFKPERRAIYEILNVKYKNYSEKYVLEEKMLIMFSERIEELIQNLFKWFLLFLERKEFKIFQPNIKNTIITHLNLSPFVLKGYQKSTPKKTSK